MVIVSKVLIDFEIPANGRHCVITGGYEKAAPDTDEAQKILGEWLMYPEQVDEPAIDGKATSELGETWAGAKVSPLMMYQQAAAAYINDEEGIVFHNVCDEVKDWKERFQSYTHKIGDRNIPNVAVTSDGELTFLGAVSKDGSAYYGGYNVSVALRPDGSIMTDMEPFFLEALIDEQKNHSFAYCSDECREYINDYIDPETIYTSKARDMKEFEKTMKSYGLLSEKEDYLIYNAEEPSAAYKLSKISSAEDVLAALDEYDDSNKLEIAHTEGNPYLEAHASDEHYILVPMQHMERMLKFSIGNAQVRGIMASDREIEKAIWKQVPDLIQGKEALYALRNRVQDEASAALYGNKDRLPGLASRLSRLHFLKLREDINSKLTTDKNDAQAVDKNMERAYQFVDDALSPKNKKYLLPAAEDKQLAKGIEWVLMNGNVTEARGMVENLFSKERSREVDRLHSIAKAVEKGWAL